MSTTEDERLIHDLVARYADAVNRRDREAWAATWTADAVWALPGRDPVRGAEAIVTQWSAAMARLPFVVQLIYHGVVDIDDDTATGTWYLSEHMKLGEDNGLFNIGCYQDRYAMERDRDAKEQDRSAKVDGGRWRFRERRYTVLYSDQGAGDMSGVFATVPTDPWRNDRSAQ